MNSITSITLPQTIKQLRSFIGTVGYYRWFIPKFANYSSLLTPATVWECLSRFPGHLVCMMLLLHYVLHCPKFYVCVFRRVMVCLLL